MTYTQGEWKQKGLSIEVDNRGVICKVLTPQSGGTFNASANARLIAAAPDLLDACEAVAYDMQAWKDGENIALDKVRAAIRAAEGE